MQPLTSMSIHPPSPPFLLHTHTPLQGWVKLRSQRFVAEDIQQMDLQTASKKVHKNVCQESLQGVGVTQSRGFDRNSAISNAYQMDIPEMKITLDPSTLYEEWSLHSFAPHP